MGKIELLSPKLRNMEKPAIDVALNNSSIEELLNQTGSLDKSLEVHQSLNSNSIGELLSPIPGVMEKSPAGNKVLNNSSIEEMLNPKTATPIEGRLQPLNSNSISLANIEKFLRIRICQQVKSSSYFCSFLMVF